MIHLLNEKADFKTVCEIIISVCGGKAIIGEECGFWKLNDVNPPTLPCPESRTLGKSRNFMLQFPHLQNVDYNNTLVRGTR